MRMVCWTDCSVLVPSRLLGSVPTIMLTEKVKVSPISDALIGAERTMLLALALGAIVTRPDVALNVSPRLPTPVIVTTA